MKQARQSAPRTKSRARLAFRTGSSTPVVTYSIIAMCVVIYIAQLFSNGLVTNALFYHPVLTEFQPWRMLTSLFVHSPSSYLHIVFNMFSLFVIGPSLEIALGRWRFLTLYLLSGLGGSVAVLLLTPETGVLGASGAIFGLLGAFFIIQRSLGGRNVQIIIVIAINLVLGFIIPNVAWEAHLGGLIVGGIVAYVMLKTRSPRKKNQQLLLLFSVLVGLVVLTVVGVQLIHSRFG
jgi:membrane associated rhomboid family serine protease